MTRNIKKDNLVAYHHTHEAQQIGVTIHVAWENVTNQLDFLTTLRPCPTDEDHGVLMVWRLIFFNCFVSWSEVQPICSYQSGLRSLIETWLLHRKSDYVVVSAAQLSLTLWGVHWAFYTGSWQAFQPALVYRSGANDFLSGKLVTGFGHKVEMLRAKFSWYNIVLVLLPFTTNKLCSWEVESKHRENIWHTNYNHIDQQLYLPKDYCYSGYRHGASAPDNSSQIWYTQSRD